MLLTSDIRRVIREKIEEYKNSLANGACGSYSDYQYTIGIIRGLEDAMELSVQTVDKRIKSEEED